MGAFEILMTLGMLVLLQAVLLDGKQLLDATRYTDCGEWFLEALLDKPDEEQYALAFDSAVEHIR